MRMRATACTVMGSQRGPRLIRATSHRSCRLSTSRATRPLRATVFFVRRYAWPWPKGAQGLSSV